MRFAVRFHRPAVEASRSRPCRRAAHRSPSRRRGVAAALVAIVLAGAAAPGPSGYLAPGAFDVTGVLQPAPTIGDPRDEADRAIFRRTRALAGSERWAMATGDVKLSPGDMMRDFSCAAGVSLSPAAAPMTAALVRRAAFDTVRQSSIAKDRFKRRRPFKADPGPTCQPVAEVADSYDYPSGHTTLGWTWATLLAWALPDRATPILARGRAFGESRVVCGMHNASAVEAGRLSATATLDAMAGDARFQADFAAARAELDRLRRDAASARPDPASCAAEAALVARPVT